MKTMISAKPKGFGYGRIGMAKSRSYEDRHFFGYVKTKSELRLTVGIVADGVGGGSFGERAAQITVDVIKNAMQNSMETDLIQVMGKAIGAANRAVFFEAQEDERKKGMSSTVVVAVIHEEKLYVANVGDSRIYLLREGKLLPLTVDHTWANDKIRSGVLDETRAKSHFNADAITRSIGFKADVVIDFGLYLQGGRENQNDAIAQQGLALDENDVILLCSDGLIKESPMGLKQRYVSEGMLKAILEGEHAEQAAKTLVDTAVGNNADDNVTAVVMEMPGRRLKFLDRRKQMMWWWGAVAVLGLAFLLSVMRLGNVRGELQTMEAANTSTASVAMMLTQEASASTATPMPTAVERKTVEIGQVMDDGGHASLLTDRMKLNADVFQNVKIGLQTDGPQGELFLQGGSAVLFESMPVRTMEFVMYENSEILVNSGSFESGARVHLINNEMTFYVDIKEGGLGLIQYTNGKARLLCLQGICEGANGAGVLFAVSSGEWTVLDLTSGAISYEVVADGGLDMWMLQVDGNSETRIILQDVLGDS